MNRESECPKWSLVDRFINGTLNEDQIDSVADHLDVCTTCAKLLTQLDTVFESSSVDLSQHAMDLQQHIRQPFGESIGGYLIRSRIASGGMSQVYEAFHPVLQKVVVVKTLHGLQVAKPELQQALRREQQILGRLSHPSIVSVFDAGFDRETPYIVMEKIDGQTLSKRIRSEGLFQLHEAIKVLRSLTSALRAIHGEGLVHRDIKPTNIMITKQGTVKLLDLGLAGDCLIDNSDDTLRGMGTPRFIAPEQQRGDRTVDGRADIYSLGATLYAMLVGKPPASEAGQRWSDDAAIPIDFRKLIDSMLSAEPSDRPSSIEEVQLRLDAIKLEPTSRSNIAWRVGVAAMIGVIGLIASVFLSISYRGETKPLGGSEAIQQAIQSKAFVSSSLTGSGGILKGTGVLIESALPRPTISYSRMNRAGTLMAAYGHDGSLRIFRVDNNELNLEQLVPLFRSTEVDAPQLTWIDEDTAIACSAADGDNLVLWDVASRKLRATIPQKAELRSSHWDALSQRLCVGNSLGEVAQYDTNGRELSRRNVAASSIESIAKTEDGYVAGTAAGELVTFGVHQSVTLRTFDTSVSAVAWNSKSGVLVAGTADGRVHEFRGDQWREIAMDCGPVVGLTWDETCDRLAVASNAVHIVRAVDLETQQLFESAHFIPCHVQWNHSALIGTSTELGVVQWDTNLNSRANLATNTASQVLSIRRSPDHDIFAVGTLSGALCLLTDAGQIVSSSQLENDDPVARLRWSPNGTHLLCVSSWGRSNIYIWDRKSAQSRTVITTSLGCMAAEWIDDTTIVAAGENGKLSLWKLGATQPFSTLDVKKQVRSLSFSPKTNLLAVGYMKSGVELFDVAAGQLAPNQELREPTAVRDLAWDSIGIRLAIVSRSGQLQLWDSRNHELVYDRKVEYVAPQEMAWSEDGTRVAVGNVGVLHLKAGSWEFSKIPEEFYSGAWSKDGSLFVRGDFLNTVNAFKNDSSLRWSLILGPGGDSSTVQPSGEVVFQTGAGVELLSPWESDEGRRQAR